MTCRCRAEFCMICGLKWKTCNCPWFNYEAVENDRLNHMNIPRRVVVPGGFPGAIPNPALGYQEELDHRREQERRDENLARRIQILGLDGADENNFIFPPPPPQHPPNATNQEFFRRAADIVSEALNAVGDHPAANTMAGLGYHPLPHVPPANLRVPPPIPTNRQPAPTGTPLRVHSVASRQYNNRPTVRASERVVPGRVVADYASEARRHQPGVSIGNRSIFGENNNIPELNNSRIRRHGSSHSAMAGLSRGSGEGRVDEWRRHIGAD